MATDLAPKPAGTTKDVPLAAAAAPVAAPDGRGVADTSGLDLRAAPESAHVAGLLEVDVPAPAQPGVEPPALRSTAHGAAVVLAVLLAPLLVLLVTVSVPASEQLQGAVLVAGWVLLGAGARWVEIRRPHRPRPTGRRR